MLLGRLLGGAGGGGGGLGVCGWGKRFGTWLGGSCGCHREGRGSIGFREEGEGGVVGGDAVIGEVGIASVDVDLSRCPAYLCRLE